ncbi:hypothetical protein [Demequina sp. NBRC 110056]|uniref:hypothetical protein n=1 Tax=Demequina sp. NBRC 110056 TaxID=1570345 RepID=UPI000A017910|nr:hypothetical protein [Demequina sp. NBRC 110056]
MRWWVVGGTLAVIAAVAVTTVVPVRAGATTVHAVESPATDDAVCGRVVLRGDLVVTRRVPLIDTQTVVSLDVVLTDPSLSVESTAACDDSVEALEGGVLVWNPRCPNPFEQGQDEELDEFILGSPGSQLATRCGGEAVRMRVMGEGPQGATSRWEGEYGLGSSGAEVIGGDMVWCVETAFSVTTVESEGATGAAITRAVEPLAPTCVPLLAS